MGGSVTTVQNYPYMSNMQYGWFGIFWSQSCGGSLITQNAVLSAAHCYAGDAASTWRVILGTSFRSTGGTTHTVSRLVVHQSYSSQTLRNDVAIVQLTSPAVLSASIGLARIAGPNYILPDGTTLMAIGWGTTTFGGSASEQLQHVDLNIINQALCAERYAYLKTQPGYGNWPDITDDMLCTGILDVGGKDACQGDSGGPMAHDSDIIVGITSWGFECADSFYPGVVARVSYFTDWILANTI